MAKYRIKEPNNPDKYEELVFISLNLRYWSKIWKSEYGTDNRVMMERYQVKMDNWLLENTELDPNPVISKKTMAVFHK